jgi:hypothetical protein
MIGAGSRKSLEEAVETRWGFGGVEKQLSERGWGVLFSTTQNILRDFLPFAQNFFLSIFKALNLLLPQAFLFSTPSLCPVKIGLTCTDIGCTRRRSPKWFKSKIRQC